MEVSTRNLGSKTTRAFAGIQRENAEFVRKSETEGVFYSRVCNDWAGEGRRICMDRGSSQDLDPGGLIS